MAVKSAQNLTVNSTVTPLTVPTIGFINSATIYVEGVPLRFTRTGVDPDNATNVGIVIPIGGVFVITGMRDMEAFKCIAADVGDSLVYIEYNQGD